MTAGLLFFYLGAQAVPGSQSPAARSVDMIAPEHAAAAQGRDMLRVRDDDAREPMRSPPPRVAERNAARLAAGPAAQSVEKNLLVKHRDPEELPLVARGAAKRPESPQAQRRRAAALVARSAAQEDGTSGEYSVRGAFISFDGPADWSIDDFAKIEHFYQRRFGRPAPVSAMGQSETHDRLGLDHRDAVDIAVRPDSPEGRALMAYLRRAGIPFIAFRGRFRGVSTGAHIHIGRPSPRLHEARQRAAPVRYDQAGQG